MGILGFEIKSSEGGGDFTPIVKYDAKAGRIFRVDRVNDGQGYSNDLIDITQTFKAVVDLESLQAGWILFAPNMAPSFALEALAKIANGSASYPAQPSDKHKNGVRFHLKLNKACGGDKQVREMAGNSNSFLRGIEEVYAEYQREAPKYPGKLPVLILGAANPVTTGSGQTKSTNYQPKWIISGWAPRPDDMPPLAAPPSVVPATSAPTTGSQTVPPPNRYPQAPAQQANTNLDDDFG